MIENLEEIIEAISLVNDSIYESLGEDFEESYLYNLQLSTDCNCIVVEFLGIQIFNSENDERLYEDICGDIIYESYVEFLKRQVGFHIAMISKIKT